MIVPKEWQEKRKKLKEEQWRKLKKLLKVVLATNKFYQRKYARVGVRSANDINSWDDFKKLPFTTRGELVANQEKHPPFGTNLTLPLKKYIFANPTSGVTSKQQLYTLYTEGDIGRSAVAQLPQFQIAGVEENDLILLATRGLGYLPKMTQKIGAVIVPSERMTNSELFKILLELPITVFYGSPSGILGVIKEAQGRRINLSRVTKIRKILTIGEILLPSARKMIKVALGDIGCYNCLGSVELRTIAFECPQERGPHLLETFNFFEVKDQSGKEANIGELITTSLWRHDFPFIRYKTGDLIELDWQVCPCGSLTPKIKNGIIRRVGTRIKLGSLFFFPDELEESVRKFSGLGEYLIEFKKVRGIDLMEIKIEMPFSKEKQIVPRLKDEVEKKFGFSPKVISVAPGTLPRSTWKSKRIIDHRLDDQKSKIANLFHDLSLQNLSRRLVRKILYSLFPKGWEEI